MDLIPTARASVLGLVRHGPAVAWTPPWMNLGNLLYLGLWAFEGMGNDSGRRVLVHPAQAPSLAVVPHLREALFVTRKEVRFTDRRVMPWSDPAPTRTERFEHPLLAPFVTTMLLPGSPLAAAPPDIDEGTMVVNVRRGDYFSVPAHRAAFGIDTRAYTLHAVKTSIWAHGLPSAILVVSDDLDWCRAQLGELADLAPTCFREGGVAQDLAALVHAPRLVIPNSTFSYWGGYIGDVLHPGREVLAPRLFDRTRDDGLADQLRPHWHRIDEIPGGWDPPPAGAGDAS